MSANLCWRTLNPKPYKREVEGLVVLAEVLKVQVQARFPAGPGPLFEVHGLLVGMALGIPLLC